VGNILAVMAWSKSLSGRRFIKLAFKLRLI
jgi:hypothetical protein